MLTGVDVLAALRDALTDAVITLQGRAGLEQRVRESEQAHGGTRARLAALRQTLLADDAPPLALPLTSTPTGGEPIDPTPLLSASLPQPYGDICSICKQAYAAGTTNTDGKRYCFPCYKTHANPPSEPAPTPPNDTWCKICDKPSARDICDECAPPICCACRLPDCKATVVRNDSFFRRTCYVCYKSDAYIVECGTLFLCQECHVRSQKM